MSLVVRKVDNKADSKVFFEFPWLLYKNDPNWVPELPSLRRSTLNKKKHAAWEYMEGDYFVAFRDGQPVGTIAAFVNHRHNEVHGENIGFFGFFECLNDQQAAKALFDTAEAYLRDKNVEAIRGPASFTSNEVYGLLIENFDLPPAILMPYNPRYYPGLIESCGYQKVMDLYAWIARKSEFSERHEHVIPDRLLRVTRQNMARRGITLRTFDTKNKKRDFQLLRQLYNEAWEKNWGFVPMTERELDNLVRDLGQLLDPDYAVLAFVRDEPAGFLLAVPDFNQILKVVNPHPGVPEIWWLLKTLWHWKVRPKATMLRIALMGVKEEFRALGVEAAMFLETGEKILSSSPYTSVDGSWVLETNQPTNQLLMKIGMDNYRRYRLYQKPL